MWQTDGQTYIWPRHSPRYACASRGKNRSNVRPFVRLSVCLSVRCQHYQNPPRPLQGRRRRNVARIHHGSWDKTSSKGKFWISAPRPRPATPNLTRSAEMTQPERGVFIIIIIIIIITAQMMKVKGSPRPSWACVPDRCRCRAAIWRLEAPDRYSDCRSSTVSSRPYHHRHTPAAAD